MAYWDFHADPSRMQEDLLTRCFTLCLLVSEKELPYLGELRESTPATVLISLRGPEVAGGESRYEVSLIGCQARLVATVRLLCDRLVAARQRLLPGLASVVFVFEYMNQEALAASKDKIPQMEAEFDVRLAVEKSTFSYEVTVSGQPAAIENWTKSVGLVMLYANRFLQPKHQAEENAREEMYQNLATSIMGAAWNFMNWRTW